MYENNNSDDSYDSDESDNSFDSCSSLSDVSSDGLTNEEYIALLNKKTEELKIESQRIEKEMTQTLLKCVDKIPEDDEWVQKQYKNINNLLEIDKKDFKYIINLSIEHPCDKLYYSLCIGKLLSLFERDNINFKVDNKNTICYTLTLE